MSTQVILLERVDNLGDMGDVVSVKPGFARNYLLPQRKAMRASKENVAYFEAQKKTLAAENDKRKAEAAKVAKKIEGVKVAIIRQASEGGQMFGSVAARDIATALTTETGEAIDRSMVKLNQNFKFIGLFPVEIALHPEVKVKVTINIARSSEEAETQAKTGKALIAQAAEDSAPEADNEDALKGALDDSALEAEKEKKAEAKAKADKDAAKAQERAAKKAAKAEDASEEAADAGDE